MNNHNTLTASHGAPLRDLLANLSTGAGTFGGKLRAGFGNAITHMQISRMQSVLNGMSDEQLATAGVTRKDIPQHARALVLDEYDGL
ncbi:hypothetical protein [Sulfitobacter sp. PS-8MA]|uniref:hypothetical protein n=1 Tax=Sulfitobacter sp. PS-8MA TaxID=3237707 RepID=UPI0034C65780